MTIATEKHANNVVIGAGEVFIDLYDADDNLTGERYAGDSASASLSVTTERATVFSGDGAVATQLVDVARSISRTLSLTLHDISVENLALFVAADAGGASDVATAVVDEEIKVYRGRWYQLGVSADKPGGVAAVSATSADTTVTNAGGTTIYTAGSDYTLDAERGRIYIEPDSNIAQGDTIKIDYTPVAGSRGTVLARELKQVRAALRYLETPMAGKGRNIYARLCSVGPSGEMALKSRDTEQQIQLVCEVLEPSDGWPALTIDGEAA